MDATVIEEIANQLGMAVDQAGAFVTNTLTQYAGLQTLQSIIGLILTIVVTIACVVILVAYYKHVNKMAENDSIYKEWELHGDIAICAFACVLLVILATAALTTFLYHALGWHFFPEAMLLDMALAKM